MDKNWLQKTASGKLMIIARGPSGSGKSHMVNKLSQELGAPIFSSDDYFMQQGKYIFDVSKLAEAHEWNRQRVEGEITKGTPIIIVDNSNTKFWEMKSYTEMAVNNGYEVKFQEPNWHPDLRNDDGTWNVDFLSRMQDQPDRRKMNKSLDTSIVDKMVNGYEYNPTIESVLRSERQL